MLIRLIIALISLGMIVKTARTRSLRSVKTLTLAALWLSIGSFAVFPSLAHKVSALLGIGENLNTLIFVGFFVLLFLIHRNAIAIEKTQAQITELVSKLALKSLERDTKKDNPHIKNND